jgi:hypothetical protein
MTILISAPYDGFTPLVLENHLVPELAFVEFIILATVSGVILCKVIAAILPCPHCCISPVASLNPPIGAGVALDIIGWQEVELLCLVHTAVFLLLPLSTLQ